MRQVWIERPIESVEYAEALPEGTVAISKELTREAFIKDGDSWLGTHGPGAFTNETAVGLLEALVPVEAEEQWGARDKAGSVTRPSAGIPDPHAALEDYIRVRAATGQHDSLVRRLCTPWEET